MSANLNQETGEVHNRGTVHHDSVVDFLERAKDDPDWEAAFYERFGYAAHAYLDFARRYMAARGNGWTSVGEGHRSVGDSSYVAARTFDETDHAGGSGVARAVSED